MSTTTATQTSDPTRTVPTRRISFEESLATLPKHFTKDGDLISSHLVAVLSSVFPDGEDFFVRSVRHYRGRISDPVLKKQMSGFIGQEAMHGREHRVFNERLAELGYPTHRLERLTKWGLAMRTKLAPAKANLAATAALEHFTATMAEALLTDPELSDDLGHEGVRNLFLWHALEESEHKAVAFDVYKAVGGSERLRVWTMKGLRYGFVFFTALQVILSLLGDKATFQRGVLRTSFRHLRESPLVNAEMWRQLCDYDRPDFHPDDRDTTELVDRFRTEFFGEAGTMNDLLISSPAA